MSVLSLLFLLCLSGCGAGPAKPLVTNHDSFTAWEPITMDRESPALMVFCAQGSESNFWEPLGVAGQRDAYRVVVSPYLAGSLPDRWASTKSLLGADVANPRQWGLVVEGADAAAAIEHAATLDLDALIVFSPARSGFTTSPEDVMRAYHGPPLLLIACENDLDGANTAHALKDAASGYCELQMYSCGVRGADLLAATPNVVPQVLAWLKPILGEGFGGPQTAQ